MTVRELVHETLDGLVNTDKQMLTLFYLHGLPQIDIAHKLGIPLGTVKSRLYAAKQRFKSSYPYPPVLKGEKTMRKLPKMLPEYTITPTAKPPFECKWEEMMGWFLIPRLGEKLSWAMYDWPERERTETYTLEVTGRARVHGVDGVEIVVHEQRGGEHEGHGESRDIIRTFVTQLTDTHCRILAARHLDGEVKQYFTFLDGDAFLGNWGFGEDNCGNEINLKAKGTIRRNGNQITTEKQGDLLDVAGRYTVTIGGKTYDCICVLDVNTYVMGGLAEYFIDANGRTVLWRRFNRNDWKLEYYGQLWSKKLPDNEQLTVNGEIYVHWYDCITDYIL